MHIYFLTFLENVFYLLYDVGVTKWWLAGATLPKYLYSFPDVYALKVMKNVLLNLGLRCIHN